MNGDTGIGFLITAPIEYELWVVVPGNAKRSLPLRSQYLVLLSGGGDDASHCGV